MKTYAPKISILLIKTARRANLALGRPAAQRFRDLDSIDLTPYLAKDEAVTVQHSIAGTGTWSCQLADRIVPALNESLYGLIEVNDMVEIRMARQPSLYGGKLPVVMRGFVSGIDRVRSMSGGQPHRRVHLAGHDYSKVLDILRIYYLNNSAVGDNVLGSMSFFHKYVSLDNAKIMSAQDFVQLVMDEVINKFVDGLTVDASGSSVGTAPVRKLRAVVSIEGTVSPLSVSTFTDGSAREFLSRFLDIGAFNEMFVEDREDESLLVIRPNHFLDLDGNPIQGAVAAAPAPTQTGQAEDSEARAAAIKAEKIAKLEAEAKELQEKALAELQKATETMTEANTLAHQYQAALAAGKPDEAAMLRAQARATIAQAERIKAGSDAMERQHADLLKQIAAAKDEHVVVVVAPAPINVDGVIDVADADIETITEGRTDAGVANYFWVTNDAWMVREAVEVRQIAAASSPEQYVLFNYVNTSAARFGFRKMEVASAMGPPGLNHGDALNHWQITSETDRLMAWLAERRRILAEQNRDNSILESGQIVMMGQERIRRGIYIQAAFGSLKSRYYAAGVTHLFAPHGAYRTIVDFERGTNFATRAQSAQGQYLAELNLNGTRKTNP